MAKKNDPWRVRIVRYGTSVPDQLLNNPSNWKIHPKPQQDAMAGTLGELGWTDEISINLRTSEQWPVEERGIETMLDGHMRAALAYSHGEMSVPTKYLDLTPAEEALYFVTHDPIGQLFVADKEQLAKLLADVQSGDSAVQQMLAELAEKSGLQYGEQKEVPDAQIDKASELQEKWGVKTGDLWLMGEHRILCGDSTKAEDVQRVMGGEKAALVVTDPPYGVEYADKNKFLNAIGPPNRIETPIDGDHGSKAETQAMWKAAFEQMGAVMQPGGVVYSFMPQGGDQMMMMMMMQGAGIEPRHELIWLKNNHVLGRVDYAYKHEPILYAWKEGGHKFYGDFQTSILEYDKPTKSDMHPTMKPVGLIEKLVSNSSRQGDVVFDPFLGSGTTLVAAHRLGRRGRGIEISPAYVAVCLERLSDMGLECKLSA